MFTFPVRFICYRNQTNNSMSNSRSTSAGVPPPVDGEEVSELGVSSASIVTPVSASAAESTTTNPVLDMKTVWDWEKIEKLGGPDPFSKRWACGWCGLTLKGWNATKVMNHASKAAGNNDVKACTGNIPKATLAAFQAFRYKKLGAATAKRQHQDAFNDSIADNQKSIAVMFEQSRVRKSATACDAIDMTGDEGGGVGASNSMRLTSAIAEFVYCKGLSFSATEGEHFMQILKLARLVPSSYRPPNRRLLSNDLLRISYESRLDKYIRDLDVDAEVYGLTLFGDGATVHGMPLMNILASGVGEPSAVLAIVDCKFLFVPFAFSCIYSFDSHHFLHCCCSRMRRRYGPSHRWWQEGCDICCVLV
jgi:hypothetical protein